MTKQKGVNGWLKIVESLKVIKKSFDRSSIK